MTQKEFLTWLEPVMQEIDFKKCKTFNMSFCDAEEAGKPFYWFSCYKTIPGSGQEHISFPVYDATLCDELYAKVEEINSRIEEMQENVKDPHFIGAPYSYFIRVPWSVGYGMYEKPKLIDPKAKPEEEMDVDSPKFRKAQFIKENGYSPCLGCSHDGDIHACRRSGCKYGDDGHYESPFDVYPISELLPEYKESWR